MIVYGLRSSLHEICVDPPRSILLSIGRVRQTTAGDLFGQSLTSTRTLFMVSPKVCEPCLQM